MRLKLGDRGLNRGLLLFPRMKNEVSSHHLNIMAAVDHVVEVHVTHCRLTVHWTLCTVLTHTVLLAHLLCTASRCKTFPGKERCQSQSTESPGNPESLQDTPVTCTHHKHKPHKTNENISVISWCLDNAAAQQHLRQYCRT